MEELAVQRHADTAEASGYPGFAALLVRLCEHRGLDTAALSRTAEVPEAHLQSTLDTGAPDPSLLRRLAPALALHTADLFLIAGLQVPADLAPVDARAGRLVASLVRDVGSLPPQQRTALRDHIRSLPPDDGHEPPATQTAPHENPWTNYGALIVSMFHTRNLNLLGTAKALAAMTDLWLSASTIGMVGAGRRELSPDLLARFAIVLGIEAADLAALTGLPLPDPLPPRHPAAADMAGLIWELRRLTADQVQQVQRRVTSLLQA